jgi:hypothetical protein
VHDGHRLVLQPTLRYWVPLRCRQRRRQRRERRDARTSRLSSSSSQILQQIDLAAREDSAQYKPNPWSIAKVNAASRPRRPNATVKSVSENPAAKKRPQGAIVDAFKRQAQKPKATTNSAAQTTRLQNLPQKPALTSAIDAPDNLTSASARSPTPTAHIATSAVDPVPIPSQLRVPQQHLETPLPSFLPRKAFPASCPSQPTHRALSPHFTPDPKRILPFSSPAPLPPRIQHHAPSLSRPRGTPPQGPVYFRPHIPEPHATTPSKAHLSIDCVAPTTSTYQEDRHLPHPPRPAHQPTPKRKTVSPYPRQNVQPPSRPQPSQPITKVSPRSETIPPSPFAQARHFFEHSSLPVATIKQPSPELEPLSEEESRPPPPPSRLRTVSPPREYADPYDQLPPSPDSEWSTLKPPTRKANGKGKSKAPDVKSRKFKLPLSLRPITPKEPPQKKARVVTYLPPPPQTKQKTVAEPRPGTRDIGTDICMDGPLLPPQWFFVSHSRLLSLATQNPRTRASGLPSPPPSDETAPPSSPTPSVQFDSNGVLSRYKIVRGKIREVCMVKNSFTPFFPAVPFDLFLRFPCFPFILVAEGA